MRRHGDQINALIDQAMEVIEDDPLFAVRLCKQAVVIAPELSMPRRHLVVAFMSAREFVNAETEVRRLIGVFPEDALLKFQLSRCLWLQDKNAEAEQEAQLLLTLTPKDQDVYFLLSRIYRDLGDPSQAVEILEQAIQLDGVESLKDQGTLLELLKLHVVEQNTVEIARTTRRIRAIIPVGDVGAANSAMACIYNLAVDFFDANAYTGAYEVLNCVSISLVNDSDLLENVKKAGMIMGAHADALRVLDDDQVSRPLKAYVYSQYLDHDDEVTEQEREDNLEEIVGDIIQNPPASQAMFRRIVQSYPNLAFHKSEFLHLLNDILNKELGKSTAASTENSSRVSVLQPPSPYVTPPPRLDGVARPQATSSPSSAGTSLFGGSCLLKIIGVVILIALLPLLVQLLVAALPAIFVGALIIGVILYFIKKS